MNKLNNSNLKIQTNERLSWIDFSRGLGIFLVVFGHLSLPYPSPFYEARTFNTMLVSSFHIPLFFFISGLCFSVKKKPLAFIKSKAASLLVPWLFFTVIWCLFKCAVSFIDGELTAQVVKTTILNFLLQKRQYAIWYLTAAFLLEVLFYFIVKLCKENKLAISIAVLIVFCAGYVYKVKIGKFLFWELDVVPLAIPFFAIGFFLKKFRNYKLKGKALPALAAVVLLIAGQLINAYNCSRFEKHFVSMFNNEYCNYFLFFISALCGIAATGLIAMLLQNHFSYVKYVGKNSLVFFGLHQILFIVLERILSTFTISDISITLIWIFAFFCTFAVLTPINELLTKTKLSLLLGKKK